MKKLLLIGLLLLCNIISYTQVPHNPFTQNIHFYPEPNVDGLQCGEIETVFFTAGLTTANNAEQWQTQPLKIKIKINGFFFNDTIASNLVIGNYSTNFTWVFDNNDTNLVIGIQNKILPGTGWDPLSLDTLASGMIGILLQIPQNVDSLPLGVNVNMEIPPYMQDFNSLPDDNESTNTQTYCYSILPVVINNFNIINKSNKPYLFWDVNNSTNLDRIEIIRNNSRIDIIDKNNNYYIDETNLINGNYQYQLKFVDLDDKYILSDIKSVNINNLIVKYEDIYFDLLGRSYQDLNNFPLNSVYIKYNTTTNIKSKHIK